MNILISCAEYPRPNLYFASFISEFAEELTRQNHNVTIIAPQSITTNLKHNYKFIKIDYSYSNNRKIIRVLRPYSISFTDFSIFRKINLLVNQFIVCFFAKKKLSNIDIIYSYSWTTASNILPYAHSNNIPLFISSGEHIIEKNIFSKKQIKKLNNILKGVICVSRKNKDESIALNLVSEDKCKVFPNSINPNLFHLREKYSQREKMKYKQEDFIIAFCGRFSNRKGVLRLNEAVKQINDPNIKLILIGNLSENEKETPDYNRIIHMGELPHEKIPEYLSCADVFVLPTLAEGCSNSIVEAMACGLPIISSNMPFNHDILDNENSILIDPMNIEEIKSAILKLYKDRNLLEKMSISSLEKSKKLRIDNRVSNIIEFIKNSI